MGEGRRPDPVAVKRAVAGYVEHWSNGDLEAWLGLFADGATLEDPVGSEVRRGSAELVDFWQLVRSMADELSLTLVGPVRVAGSEAAFAMEARTRVGETSLVVDVIDTMEFDEQARITSMRAYWDPTEMRLLEG